MDNPENNGRLSGTGIAFATKIKATGFSLFFLLGICFIYHIIMRGLSRRGNEAAGGLNPRILKTLPVVIIGEDAKDEVFKNGSECAVCLSEFCDGEKARILPKCQHGYHADCIDMWFQSHSDCPLCRSPVDANGNETSSTASSSSMAAVVAAEESSMVASSGGPEGVSVIDIPKQIMDEEKEQEQDQDQAAASSGGPDGVWVIDMPRQIEDEEKLQEHHQKPSCICREI